MPHSRKLSMKTMRKLSLVVRREVEIGGDDAAQKVAEGDVHRRAVVDRADAHLQHAVGAAGRLAASRARQVGMDLALGQLAGALRRDAEEIGACGRDRSAGRRGRPPRPGSRRGRAAPSVVSSACGSGLRGFHVAGLRRPVAERVTQRRAAAGGLAELLRQLAEQVLGVEIAARAAGSGSRAPPGR